MKVVRSFVLLATALSGMGCLGILLANYWLSLRYEDTYFIRWNGAVTVFVAFGVAWLVLKVLR